MLNRIPPWDTVEFSANWCTRLVCCQRGERTQCPSRASARRFAHANQMWSGIANDRGPRTGAAFIAWIAALTLE